LLREDLARFEQLKPDAVVSELKAAAVDVVTAWAVDKGFEVVYIDNEPISTEPGVSLEEEVLKVIARIKGLPEHTNK
jgi:cyclic 2,3-diphosphoglycerate synthetase